MSYSSIHEYRYEPSWGVSCDPEPYGVNRQKGMDVSDVSEVRKGCC
jgi:hypothetical protein